MHVAETGSELQSFRKWRWLVEKHPVEIPIGNIIRAEVNMYLQMKINKDADDDSLMYSKNAHEPITWIWSQGW